MERGVENAANWSDHAQKLSPLQVPVGNCGLRGNLRARPLPGLFLLAYPWINDRLLKRSGRSTLSPR
jgi:hypothetical protein